MTFPPNSPKNARDAFCTNEAFLVELKASNRPSPVEHSRHIQEKVLTRVEAVDSVPGQEAITEATLEILASGLLCGALDGAHLYSEHHPPRPLPGALEPGISAALNVAHTNWRESDADGLQLLAGYGKRTNAHTVEENLEFLSKPQTAPKDVQRAYLETFRTGYCIGLIDAAVVFVAGERPGQPKS